MSYSGMRHRITNTGHHQASIQTPIHSRVTLHAAKTELQNKTSWTFQNKSTLFAGAGLLCYITFVVLSLVVIHRSSRQIYRLRGQFVDKSWPRGGFVFSKSEEVEEGERARGRRHFVQGEEKKELSGIRFLIDGSSLYGSSLLYFLHCRCSVHSTFILHSSWKARPVSSFIPAPIGPSKLSIWTCSQDKKSLKSKSGGCLFFVCGRSITFHATSIGQHIPFRSWPGPKKWKIPSKVVIISREFQRHPCSHFDGIYPPFLSKQIQLGEKSGVRIEKPF